MPYARNGKTKIYFETVGDGPALVLQHGYTHDLHNWHYHGWVTGLQNEYQLILIDARGAGASDCSHNPDDYSMELFAGDVVAVLDQVGVDKTHFFGYSRGSLIGCALAHYAPERLLSLILGGHYPNGNEQARNHARQLFGSGMDAYYAKDAAPGLIATPEFRARNLGNDADALIAAAVAPSTVEILTKLTVPCLLYSGEADMSCEQVKQILDQVPNARFFSLANLGHGQAFRYSHQVLPRIKEFLREVTPPAEQNRATIYRIIRAFNCADYDALEQHYHPDWQLSAHESQTTNVKQMIHQLFSVFADAEAQIRDITADGETVTTQWIFKGTNNSKWMGIEPNGTRLTLSGVTIDRFQDGKIIESALHHDAI